jgi:DNA-binding beta-propeller fold protein YncE
MTVGRTEVHADAFACKHVSCVIDAVISPDGAHAYVVNALSSDVSVIDSIRGQQNAVACSTNG